MIITTASGEIIDVEEVINEFIQLIGIIDESHQNTTQCLQKVLDSETIDEVKYKLSMIVSGLMKNEVLYMNDVQKILIKINEL